VTASSWLSADGDREPRGRIPILYVAPWVDIGGSDKGTIDWFRWLDRDRFAPSLITTQPSPNRRLGEVYPFAEEVWALPECMAGHQFPAFIFDFLYTRRVPLVHIMNSRLAYELLPDLRCFDFPPAVVVQLHVEEPDRSGYVRYVAARYGNLVDAFSVSSHHLAAALAAYDVTMSKVHVIPTGVDAEHEFNPERVRPVEGFAEPGTFRILFPGRLTEQKDPLLMVEVIGRVVASHEHVRVDVVGDGPLEEDVRRRVREAGIERYVGFHPPTAEPARWLAGSDVLLMTSTFEGVPYTAYEALAMKVPVVAPALLGNVELMSDGGGWLIEARDDADAYAAAIRTLIEDERLRSELGAAGRARMVSSFSVPEMARRHEGLYDRLLASRESPPSKARPPARQPSLRFTSRPTTTGALVSVVTPCYNHGHYLPALVDSLAAQNYPAIELIVCDDGSDDPETLEQLARLEQEGSARVVRQARGGPSAARNRAIAAASGRYILPVDADNVLLPGAVRSLVEQLQSAGDRVGFIYPTVQYFGNRDYCFRPPAYNLYALLHGNFADTCSLFDRAIFDAGLRFPEDIALGHEDWDLALSLGARDAIGEPSRSTVMLYRKHGFTRSDLVEYLRLPFSQEIQDRHPELFGIRENKDVGAWGRYKGPGLRVKARWNPALAIIASEPVEFESLAGDALLRGIKNQRCRDFELIAQCPQVPRIDGMVVRRVPPGLSGSVAERLEEALSISRARYLLVAQSAAELLADPTIVERLLRSFWIDTELRAVVFADARNDDARFPCALLERADSALGVHALSWRRELHDELGWTLDVAEGNELGSLTLIISGRVDQVHWRHFPIAGGAGTSSGGRRQALALERKRPRIMLDSSVQAEQEERLRVAQAIPAMPEHQVPRWDMVPAWMPPETGLAVRLVNEDGTCRPAHVGTPPPGYKIEFHLGSIQRFSPPGTRRLIRRAGHYLTLAPGSPREDNDEELGYLEEAPLPLFIGIERAVLEDGSETLVAATDRDPLRARARELSFLGFIESFPNEPVELPRYTAAPTWPVLTRWIDSAQRRHTYDALLPPYSLDGARVLGAELGRLYLQPDSTSIPVWLDADRRISTDRYEFSEPTLAPERMLRYAAAPLNWRGFGTRAARARSSLRRTVDCQRLLLARVRAALPRRPAQRALPAGEDQRRLLGYLQSLPAPGFVELFAASHIVLPDQFLTLQPLEAITMGYVDVCSLGYIQADAPLTGRLDGQGAAVPWASRFGLEAHLGR
jgi:glycosyltransferase involved in cell wall biosynthesis